MNKALKAKWLWRFAKEDNTLWKNMVKVTHDVDRFGYWKAIISRLDNFKSLVNFEVKNEPRILFWYDVWCGDQPLKDQFFRIFLGWHILKMRPCNKGCPGMKIKSLEYNFLKKS